MKHWSRIFVSSHKRAKDDNTGHTIHTSSQHAIRDAQKKQDYCSEGGDVLPSNNIGRMPPRYMTGPENDLSRELVSETTTIGPSTTSLRYSSSNECPIDPIHAPVGEPRCTIVAKSFSGITIGTEYSKSYQSSKGTKFMMNRDVKTQASSSRSRKRELKNVSKPQIKIIVTSPPPSDDIASSDASFSSGASVSSLSTNETLDTTRLMPPSAHNLNIHRQIRSSEAAEVKAWLIGCMNRKADTLPRKLVYRMMEMYHIGEDELDPKMVQKLGVEAFEDEGVALDVIEGFDGVEALRSLRSSFREKAPARLADRNMPACFNDTIIAHKRSHAPFQISNTPGSTKKGANPRAWRKSPTPQKNSPPSYSFPPYSDSNHKHAVPATSAVYNPYMGKVASSKPNFPRSKSTPGHSDQPARPPMPRVSSTPSLTTIPEDPTRVVVQANAPAKSKRSSIFSSIGRKNLKQK